MALLEEQLVNEFPPPFPITVRFVGIFQIKVKEPESVLPQSSQPPLLPEPHTRSLKFLNSPTIPTT